MWRMLQADEPDTFVLATNRTETVRDFVTHGVQGRRDRRRVRKARANSEAADRCATGKTVLVRINPKFYRPAEVELLIGDPAKAKAKLGWEPTTSLEELCRDDGRGRSGQERAWLLLLTWRGRSARWSPASAASPAATWPPSLSDAGYDGASAWRIAATSAADHGVPDRPVRSAVR